MMFLRRYILRTAFVLLLLAGSSDLFAQRTAKGLNVAGLSAVSDLTSAGVELYFGKNLFRSYTGGGLIFGNTGFSTPMGEDSYFTSFEGFYDFMWRAFYTRSRNFNVYVGADLFIGAEILDMYAKLTAPTFKALENAGYQSAALIFGASPRVEAEWFLGPYFSLNAGLRFAFTAGSQRSGLPLGCLRYSFAFGSRITF